MYRLMYCSNLLFGVGSSRDRVSLNETPEFLFWCLYICVDFSLRNQETKRECQETCIIIIFLNKTACPHS